MNAEGSADSQDIKDVKHDIKNELSSIMLALEQLRYEVPGDPEEFDIYFEMISNGAKNIDNLLKNL